MGNVSRTLQDSFDNLVPKRQKLAISIVLKSEHDSSYNTYMTAID